jgi:dTDP-4-dehydrorhamnose reductase
VRAAGGNHLIFRLCWVYGGRGQNFLRTMLRLATTRDELRVVNDQAGCPTWSRMIAEATAQAVARVLSAPEPEAFNGVYHLASAGSTTWHGFAEAIVGRVPPTARQCKVVTPITTAQYPTPARRPVNSILDCRRLQQVFGLRLPDWRASLDQVFESPIEGFESWNRPA